MLCFPYAGGAAVLYRQWPALLEPTIDVCPVELPGRGLRMAEPPIPDMTSLCDVLVPALEPLFDAVPVVLFGHSMGARIAFEIARRFDGRVTHLFASGSPAPGTRWRHAAAGDRRPTAQLTDDEFKQRLRDLGGTPPQLLANDELMVRVLPLVRADFVLIERYRVEPDIRVSCPITVFAGIDDDRASPTALSAWALRTTGRYRQIDLDAGHFFLESHRAQIHAEITRDLAPWLA
jgi:surfactin synthase thioesterase subunit